MRQCIYIYRKLLKCLLPDHDITWPALGFLFRKSGPETRSMHENYKLFMKGKKGANGRPPRITSESAQLLCDEIDARYREKKPMTRRDILSFVSERFKVDVSKKWVQRFVTAQPNLAEATAWPMPLPRAEVSNEELQRFYEELRELMKGIHPSCCFNIDEIGFSRRVNQNPITCIVPKSASGTRVEYVVTEDLEKTFTGIVSVSLDGSWVKPMIICPVKTLPNDFLTKEVWVGQDCFLVASESGFSNRGLFSQWYKKVMRPALTLRRGSIGNSYAPALILCDGFRGHVDAEINQMMAADNVRLVVIPPHSSHLTQPLDKFVFANMKAFYFASDAKEGDGDRNGRKIKRILGAFYKSVSPNCIRQSWDAVGIRAVWDSNGLVQDVIVDGQRVMTSRTDVTPAMRRTKRSRLETFLVNSAELSRYQEGLCAACGQRLPPRLIIRLRVPVDLIDE